ncbi:hypothetical protein E3U55_06060 [Filobacillus milosensis]|uniref:Uncharacterized protein n=1 Tax=Filobacillus milosensis TaxID=94137 RepID=A0A4Y8IUN0_9BACI|nr:hypothetical protein [Filobacillus milosensis]TFB22798.1 hypothetical protein E3U55_06060 [Filobacillus milosensis]
MKTILAISVVAMISFQIVNGDQVVKDTPKTQQDSESQSNQQDKQTDATQSEQLTTSEAEKHVERALQLDEKFKVRYDGAEPSQSEYEGENMALIQVYETNEHATATYGWYYIDMDNGDLYKYTIATNEITKKYELNEQGEYQKVE